jgi:hypothetical protein
MNYTDDVRGIIIGGDTHTGYIFYDGRMQTGAIVGNTEQEMLTLARRKIESLKQEFKGFPTYLYQNDSLWEVRVSK